MIRIVEKVKCKQGLYTERNLFVCNLFQRL